jgi:hypothetical protein
MATLWNISSDLLDIEALLTESEGEIADDEAGEALAAWFDQLIEDRDNKIDNYCRLITSITARANARAAEASRLDALTTTDQLAVERLKTALKTFMERHDLKKLETPLHKLTVAANGGRLPLIIPETWQQDPELAPGVSQDADHARHGGDSRRPRRGRRCGGVRIRRARDAPAHQIICNAQNKFSQCR